MTAMPSLVSSANDPLANLLAHAPQSAQPWLTDLRTAALGHYTRTGLPTVRNEMWRYTNLRPLEKLTFQAPSAEHRPFPLDALPAVAADTYRAVVVNGRFRPDLSQLGSLPAGVRIQGLAEALAQNDPLLEASMGRLAPLEAYPILALNTSLFTDGVLIHLPRNTTVAQPIEVVFVTVAEDAPVAIFPRLLVVAEANSEATIVEHHVGFGTTAYLNAAATEVHGGPNSRVHHYTIQREAPQGYHLSTSAVRLERDAVCDSFVLQAGGKLARREARATLDGTGIEYRISGGYMVSGEQHSDITTFIDHAQPQCQSREVVKGVIDNHAKAVFQGKILVRPDSQKTDGYQINRALLLSDTAEINSKPELEIYADDVKCSHGATAGELDEQGLFYLRARGIDETTARNLLVEAFLAEVVEEIQNETVRTYAQGIVSAWLEARVR